MRRGRLLGAGLATLALAWAPGTEHLFGHGFTGHMIRHMGVVAVAAPLIALGLAGTKADPSTRAPWLFAAVPVSLVELLVVWGWHAPAAHDLARESALAFAAEQGSFLISGLWLWFAAFGHAAGARARRAGEGALAMLLTSIHMTLLGALLSMSARPLYAAHHAGDPLSDQHLGGIVMLLVGGAVYLAGGIALSARLLGDDAAAGSAARSEAEGREGIGGAERNADGRRPVRDDPHPALPFARGGITAEMERSRADGRAKAGATSAPDPSVASAP